MRCAPLARRARAVASPMPLAPPVITATAPAKFVNAIETAPLSKKQAVCIYSTALRGWMSIRNQLFMLLYAGCRCAAVLNGVLNNLGNFVGFKLRVQRLRELL